MHNKVVLSIFPVTTILLMGASPTLPGGGMLGQNIYQFDNKVDSLIVGAIEKGKETYVSFTVSFNSVRTNNTIEITKLDPIERYYLPLKSYQTTQMMYSDSFYDFEEYSSSDYVENGYPGPSYRFIISSPKQTRSHAFLLSFKEKSESLNSYFDETGYLESTVANVFCYAPKLSLNGYVKERFSYKSYFENKIYEFDEQNYLSFEYSVITNYLDTTLEEEIPFPNKNSFFMISDLNNYFPNLRKAPNNPVITIIGKLQEENKGYSFEFTDDLYIDPSDRLTYKEKEKGTIKTKKLYFPLDASSRPVVSQEAKRVFLFIDEAGLSRSRVILGCDFDSFSNDLFGECATSMYCIKALPSEPDFEIGYSFSSDD